LQAGFVINLCPSWDKKLKTEENETLTNDHGLKMLATAETG
jgi:hypothetical protein